MMRSLFIVACASLLVVVLSPPARASDVDKMMLVTFSQPVALPDVALPAGTYRFELADPSGDRTIVRVTNEDGTTLYGTFLTLPERRLSRRTPPVTLEKGPAGAPESIDAWFYSGDTIGYEFLYPQPGQ